MTGGKSAAVKILANALGIEVTAVGPDTRLGLCAQWDSLAHMRIILALEKSIGQPLPAAEILSIEGFDDVIAVLANRTGGS